MADSKGGSVLEQGPFWGTGAPQEGGTGSWKTAKTPSPKRAQGMVDYGQVRVISKTSAVVDKGQTPQEAGPISLFASPKTVSGLAIDMAEGGDAVETQEMDETGLEDKSDTPSLRTDSDSDQESLAGEKEEDNESLPDLVESLDDIEEDFESEGSEQLNSEQLCENELGKLMFPDMISEEDESRVEDAGNTEQHDGSDVESHT